jgi:hypothetical protein
MRGQCLCGAIRYSFETAPLLSFVCHCLDCQMSTGSAFGTFTVVKDRDFKIAGTAKSYSCKADSGRTITRYFCDACGSSLYSTLEKTPGVVVVSVGTLEGGGALIPQRHSWVKRKHAWVKLEDAVRQFQEEMP